MVRYICMCKTNKRTMKSEALIKNAVPQYKSRIHRNKFDVKMIIIVHKINLKSS